MSTETTSYGAGSRRWGPPRALARPVAILRARPEIGGLVVLAGLLNLWGLQVNGWANTYYAAAVRSMSTSWHDFLFISLDRTGLMTVDKPPLALWIQALSARIFGFDSLALLVPQALMGVAAAVLVYDLVRRRFGRIAGFVSGFALATTPVAVAVSRHNNPDELLVLCCVAAVWLAARALETGGTKWLMWCGVAVGLGFETKMGVALMVVPGIAAAYLYVAPRGRAKALGQLVAGGASLAVVGLAWPVVVTLTPAADRPWISGTADNSIWSLILNYNGVGRIAGQTGGPGGGAGGPGGGAAGPFGGATGLFRLLQTSLGDQAGWLLGFAIVAGVGLMVSSRLRRRDPVTGWVIVVGGAFVTTVVVFSFASGIFHPYYVSFLAPFTAALIGGGVGLALSGTRTGRATAVIALIAGAVTELVVIGTLSGSLSWGRPLAIAGAIIGVVALALTLAPRVRLGLIALALAALLAAPAAWATETLGHATSSTFPTGGPASAGVGGPGGGGPGSSLGFGRGRGFGRLGSGAGPGAFGPPGGFAPPAGLAPSGAGGGGGAPGVQGLLGSGHGQSIAPTGTRGASGFARRLQSLSPAQRRSLLQRFRSRAGGGAGGPPGVGGAAGFGADSSSLKAAVRYVRAHGGGAIGVESQSSAAEAIVTQDAEVAGLGGFSGRESTVSAGWLAMEVRDGRLRWIVSSSSGLGRAGHRR